MHIYVWCLHNLIIMMSSLSLSQLPCLTNNQTGGDLVRNSDYCWPLFCGFLVNDCPFNYYK